MKKLLENIVKGRDGKTSGIIALSILMLIVLGCNCKNLDLGNRESGTNRDRSSNTSRTSDDADYDSRDSNDADSETTSSDGSPSSDLAIDELVAETMDDFTKAIDTNDFSEIYEKASPDFQASYTENEMKDAFKVFTQQRNRVVPILKKTRGMELEMTKAPSVRKEKNLNILVVDGKFSTKPFPVRLENEYVFRNGEWKLLKLIVKIQ